MLISLVLVLILEKKKINCRGPGSKKGMIIYLVLVRVLKIKQLIN